jgi:uncharacterized membrane protein YedE/YeeE
VIETAFTPGPALLGGALIGLSAGALMLGVGRIAGISGIVGGLLSGQPDRSWRLWFLVGLLGAPVALAMAGLVGPIHPPSAGWLTALAGVLVGVGTRLGSGCTSGHGVCGMARLSLRSIVATGVFMGVAVLTVFVVRHALGA